MDLFIKTPLIESISMQEYVKYNQKVYLKLENLQPSGSFKLRGISRLCQYALDNGYKDLVTASGGNAGLAVAYVCQKLGINCQIIVPSMASTQVIETLRKFGAKVEVFGQTSADVSNRALELTKMNDKKYFVHPFDDQILWSGHSTIIDEIAEQLNEDPGVIVSVCGGGGLLCGIIEGMRRKNWTSVPVIAMETVGTGSFNACVRNGGRAVTLDKWTGIAVSLSPIRVCDQLIQYYYSNESKPPILSHLVEDIDAFESCVEFANNHKILVEPACGTALSAVYKGIVNEVVDTFGTKGKPIVVIVCGGSAVTLNALNVWSKMFQK